MDEVVGQLLTYSLLPVAGRAWTPVSFGAALAAGFFLFRFLDIVKPGPVDDLQACHGGLGIMADDFLAGVIGGWVMLVLTVASGQWPVAS
jgi:phosphatidylglycerophosphatase A